MAILTGTVVSAQVDVQVKKKDGGTYPGYRVIYTNDYQEVKTIEKHMNDLKYKPAVDAVVRSAKAGDRITIVQEKNEKGFLDIQSMTIGEGAPVPQLTKQDSSAPPAAKAAFVPNNTGGGRDFESKDEREKKQVYIIRQSSLSAAINTLQVGAKKLDAKDVVALAAEYTDFVLGNTQVVKQETAAPAADFNDDVPY